MSDISLIGLGAMGAALATAMINAGHKVTVWNRTAAKTQRFVALGAAAAASLPDAIEASPATLICIDNYDATRALFEESGATAKLRGRRLIQLSTGTPKEARAAEDWAQSFGAVYLDGAIMPYPDQIGDPDAQILFAGPQGDYQALLPLLSSLGGDLRFVGENIAAAAALDMSLLTVQLSVYFGALHGAHACEAEGVDLKLYASMFPAEEPARGMIEQLAEDDYSDRGANLIVWEAALQRIQRQARDAGINGEVPDFISSLFHRAIKAGYGAEDVGAIIKVLRAGV